MTQFPAHASIVGRTALAIAAVCALASCADATNSQQAAAAGPSKVSFGPCPQSAAGIFTEGTVSCGVLHVPENRAKPGSRMLDLPFSILKASAANPQPDPVLVLVGGPGGSAHMDVASGYMPLEQLRKDRDIIVLEQRGTGYTSVPLVCADADSHPVTPILRNALTACRDRMRREGVDFTGYDTAANAQDFVDLGRLLGIRSWNLFGISYGTRLGLVLMRDHGVNVRSAVLDAAYPLTMNTFFTGGQLQGFSHVVRACNQDAKCAAQHPRLRENFIAAIEHFDKNPFTLRGQRFGGEIVVAILRGALGRPENVSKIPAAIDRAAQGDLEPLLAMGWIRKFELPPLYLAHGMYALVECRDSYYQAPPLDAREAPTGGFAGWPASVIAAVSRSSAQERMMCEIFNPGSGATPMGGPVHSAIPTLVINGEFDGGTTSEMGDQIAADLENAVHITTRGGGHSSVANPCIRSIIESFIDKPSKSVDTRCTQAIEPLKFE
ncbi:MAG: alpha/beta fold hydrolase [Longimicrobiales bacterium]